MSVTINKNEELIVNISLLNDKLHFSGDVGGAETISIDYTPPYGDNLGFTSLELFLFSLTSCYASSLLAVLRQMKKNIKSMSAQAHGYRNSEHPKCFGVIDLHFTIASTDIKEEDCLKASAISEEKLCPVFAMIKGNVELKTQFTILAIS